MRTAFVWVLSVLMGVSAAFASQTDAEGDYWVSAMRQVHKEFDGEPGTFAHFGDSITITLAYWTPLLYERKNASDEMARAYSLVKEYMQQQCWRQWKGPKFGNQGRMTIRWAHENVDAWLARLDPEVALIMFGTNDLNSVPLDEYEDKYRQVVRKCLQNGTVVILSTIPPRHGFADKAARYARAVRQLASEMKVPLIDFHAQVIKRRPDDWDGAMEKFSAYRGYDVPTLIARDGVHPSNCKKYLNDYSPDGLAHNGFMLRNYLSLMKYAEVLTRLEMVESGSKKKADMVAEPSPSNQPHTDWWPQAPVLPAPTGNIVRVSNVKGLVKAIENAEEGQTILVADGHYYMPRYVEIRADEVTLRSESGVRERVVIDGAKSMHGELIGFRACRGVMVADITIQNIRYNGFKINSETDVQNLTIRNCIIHNIWQRGVKGVKVPKEKRARIRPRSHRIEYCLFYNDRPKRPEDDPGDIAGGNYIGGIDVMFAKNWTICDNVFVNINGRTGEGRGAIFVWHEAEGCIIERNIIIDCDAGICLGNPHRPAGMELHCTDFLVRNNFVKGCGQGGITAVYTKDCRVLHNTILEMPSEFGRLIRVVFGNDGFVAANNLLAGPGVRKESQSRMVFENNVRISQADIFEDASAGNLHLKNPLPETVPALERVRFDIDRQRRNRGKCLPGADEARP